MILVILAYYGGVSFVPTIALLIAFYELASFALYLGTQKSGNVFSPMRAATVTTLFSSSVVTYLLPAILLLQQPSQAAQMIGLLWITASTMHTVVAHGSTHLLGWATVMPMALCMSLALALSHAGPVAPITDLDRLVIAFFCLCWIGNLFEVMVAQAANRRAFGKARFDAETRLKALDHLARHDALTGLLNRAAFDEALSDSLLLTTPEAPVTVVLIDLDLFKPINDTHGHAAGDHVLSVIAERLRSAIPDGQVARLGGDEFVALMPGLGDAEQRTRAKAIERAINAPIAYEGILLSTSASLGFANSTAKDTVSTLIARADRRMYAAKSERKSDRASA